MNIYFRKSDSRINDGKELPVVKKSPELTTVDGQKPERGAKKIVASHKKKKEESSKVSPLRLG